MSHHRTISADEEREAVFKKLVEVATAKGMTFSEIIGRLAQNYLKVEYNIISNPSIDDNFEDWQEYAHDCSSEEFAKLINFNTRLTNTVKRNECLIRKE